MKNLALNTLVLVLKASAYVLDCLTYIPYYLIQGPDKVLKKSKRIKAVPVSGNPSDPWRSVDVPETGLTTALYPNCNNLGDLFNQACQTYPSKPSLGTRELLVEEDEVQANGKVFKKVILGNYYWKTYSELKTEVTNLGNGLLALGQKPKDRIVVFAETRAEWMIAAQACFQCNFTVVTLYATLGIDAVIHGITETGVTHVITSIDLLPNFQKILLETPSVTHVIVMGAANKSRIDHLNLQLPDNVAVVALAEVMGVGTQDGNNSLCQNVTPPSLDDLAVIMYTSGSTGLPKGVLISHRNLLCGTSGQVDRIPGLGEQDTYVGYLPLAHVLELSAEISCVARGTRIGYSSAMTLTDNSSKIKKGSQGDVTVLKPTLVAAVPVVLDRIYKTVWDKVNSFSFMKQLLFKFAYDYKLRHLQSGFDTPLCNKVVFKAVRAILGGRVRLMLSGGAPLSGTTQHFMNICFCCPVGQGYGLTETCGAGTVLEFSDLSTNRVGAPLICCEIQLRNWEEGNYTTNDKPYPRGEILIGGGQVTQGYFKNPEKTDEDFFQQNGMQYFCTGDIGQFEKDGCLRIIDRKKDLVKLQNGEYIALSKVETILKMCPLVEQICVIAHPDQSTVVALIVPNEGRLQPIAKKLGLESGTMKNLCHDKRVANAVQKELATHGMKSKLPRVETPVNICLFPDPWLPDSGLLTDSFKLKRKVIEERFKAEINDLYKG